MARPRAPITTCAPERPPPSPPAPLAQYSSVPGADLSGLPDPLPFPYALTAEDTKAPGWLSVCFARSPSAPGDCQGDECNVFLEEWVSGRGGAARAASMAWRDVQTQA